MNKEVEFNKRRMKYVSMIFSLLDKLEEDSCKKLPQKLTQQIIDDLIDCLCPLELDLEDDDDDL